MNISQSINYRLKTQHESIATIVSQIEPARQSMRPRLNKWNIHDNIAHLARYQLVFIDRIHQILLEEAPVIGRYDANDDPSFESWLQQSTGSLVNKINAERKTIYELVTTLDTQKLARVGIHKKYGRLDIGQWTEFFLLHEAHHIFTIFQLAHDTELT
jgi:hypothetical protein